MPLGTPAVLAFYRNCRDDAALVLATVVVTAASTCRKPGAMMLINQEGDFAGLISGGYLEGDPLRHAARVFADGAARRLTRHMSADDALVWELGLGCDGVVRLHLQRLERTGGFSPTAQLERSHGQGPRC